MDRRTQPHYTVSTLPYRIVPLLLCRASTPATSCPALQPMYLTHLLTFTRPTVTAQPREAIAAATDSAAPHARSTRSLRPRRRVSLVCRSCVVSGLSVSVSVRSSPQQRCADVRPDAVVQSPASYGAQSR